jgi:SAM-dependent methyltransferase
MSYSRAALLRPRRDMHPLTEEKRNWEDFAAQDPFWAVLSQPDRKYGRWDRDAFYRTGEEQIAEVMDNAARFEVPQEREAALDFGSGVGRLTRALAGRFDRAVGVDISQTMVDNATRLNEDIPNVWFQVNARPDLGVFEDASFDMVNTRIVLQHLPDREMIFGYVAEFLRVLRPGGLLAFQLPSGLPLTLRLQPRRNVYLALRRLGLRPRFLYWRLGLHPNRMVAVPKSDVVEFLEARGGRVLDVITRRDPDVHLFEESVYYVTKS